MKEVQIKNKRVAKAWMAYLSAVMVVTAVVLIILKLVGVLPIMWFALIEAVIVAVLVVFNYAFMWVQYGSLRWKDDCIIYEFYDIVSISSQKDKYTITSIDSVKKKGKNLLISGGIKKKEPLRKEKEIKKCVIYGGNTEDVMDLISSFNAKTF